MERNYVIRRLELSDVESLTRLDEEIFEQPWEEASFYFSLENEFTYGIGIEKDGELVGYMIFSCILGDANLDNIAIKKEHRKLGLASVLIEKLIKISEENEWNQIMLEVRNSNKEAISLYEKFGFRYISTRKNYYGEGIDADIMIRVG
ncbi:MAG: ribosomal protein S18-alanine N-acetyltransferase [Tissierellia bacterium]|nr:ribosomal protein S18-alanine N-acetyltransferase [Tissierellia bacterium]